MIAPVFVDTNIFVYAVQANEPEKRSIATQWIERLWRDESARTSIQVLNELYVTLTRKIRPAMRPADAWDHVSSLFALEPRPLDRDTLAGASEISRRFQLSWWDSLIVAAAQLQNCAVLLSEDLQDRSTYGSVTVRNPFSLSVAELPGLYASVPAPVARHRPRGRPKKRA